MDLLDYLDTHFLTRAQLLAATATTDAQLAAWQAAGALPQPSYRLRLQVVCSSFFGPHDAAEEREYYARGYCGWIGLLQSGADAFATFDRRYRARLAALPLRSTNPKLGPGLAQHIADEWQAFLDGTYGLCTRSGLPEDIAQKELAIAVIQDLVADGRAPQDGARAHLETAVRLLDAASSPFAPHERTRSSRRRYVDELCLRYGFTLAN